MTFLGPDASAALARLAELEAGRAARAPLDRLRAVRALIAALERDPAQLDAVREALAAGAGWPEIADAAGLTPGAARQRWAGGDEEIARRQEASRKRKRERPSSKPSDLPGLSVAEAAARFGVSAQAIYLRVERGTLAARTIELPDGRRYKRVFPDGEGEGGAAPAEGVPELGASERAAPDDAGPVA
ncbi:hypothetical protein ACWKWP_13495 [Agromyces soli]